jgi:hypothetical protein
MMGTLGFRTRALEIATERLAINRRFQRGVVEELLDCMMLSIARI